MPLLNLYYSSQLFTNLQQNSKQKVEKKEEATKNSSQNDEKKPAVFNCNAAFQPSSSEEPGLISDDSPNTTLTELVTYGQNIFNNCQDKVNDKKELVTKYIRIPMDDQPGRITFMFTPDPDGDKADHWTLVIPRQGIFGQAIHSNGNHNLHNYYFG